MSLRKQINEVNRTRRRLASWLDRHPHGPTHYTSMFDPMEENIAGKLGTRASAVGIALTEPPLSTPVKAFLYEESLLKPWSTDGRRPIDDFIAKQARREHPLGRRFLTALAQSTPRIWEIVDIDPGSSLLIRPLREKSLPEEKIRQVYDILASKSAALDDYLFARVLPMPEGRIFATSILPVSRSEALALSRTSEKTLVQASFVAWGAAVLCELASLDIDERESPSMQSQNSAVFEESRFAGNTATHGSSASTESTRTESAKSEQTNQHANGKQTQNQDPVLPENRAKLLERIRKLFAMAQETEASPYEAEIALRRCQKLMMRYGIQESDLHTSQFSSETFRAGNRVPMHIKWLATSIELLHCVLFVTGGREGPEFRGFDIDVKVAKLTMEYLENATERSLAARRNSGKFPPGRSAAYDYRVSFAMEVHNRVVSLVAERNVAEAAATVTGTALAVKKRQIVEHECAQDLVTSTARYNGARPGDAADAGRFDGSKVSLDPQVETERRTVIESF